MELSIHYTTKMVANAESFSPSAGKPAQVMDSWASLGLPLNIVEPLPVSVDQLFLAHDRAFVEGVLAGSINNGFGNKLASVATSLPYTSGVMLSAAREALSNQCGAIAPCSGFHHAGYDFAGGYCTFNGLMVTAAVLLAEGKVGKIGILDCDQHWGNGTQDIIDRMSLSDRVVHYTPCNTYGRAEKAEAFLAALPQLLTTFADCDLVLYQAGADPHINDPLGGWLTTAQLYQRDVRVFQSLRNMGLPVAWNLAGGYQRDAAGTICPVLTIHDNTLRAFAETWGIATAHNETRPSKLSA
ncbi:MAG: hypothetical protein KAY78_00985 [Pseudomonadales bacterium]|nr:hypothetical protein [Pseudomonadales bacterium]